MTATEPVVRLHGVGLRYGKTQALADIALDLPAGRMVGLIGPDGVGKSSLFALVAGARAVARNIFLDGNTLRDSCSVDKKSLVGDLQFGFVMDWPDIRLSYTRVIRTREFQTQNGGDDFGAFSVSVKF